jgi:hypothetical protein
MFVNTSTADLINIPSFNRISDGGGKHCAHLDMSHTILSSSLLVKQLKHKSVCVCRFFYVSERDFRLAYHRFPDALLIFMILMLQLTCKNVFIWKSNAQITYKFNMTSMT